MKSSTFFISFHKMVVKSSSVQHYYDVVIVGGVRKKKCRQQNCTKQFEMTTGSNNLVNHLLNKHKELHIEYLIQKGKQNTNNSQSIFAEDNESIMSSSSTIHSSSSSSVQSSSVSGFPSKLKHQSQTSLSSAIDLYQQGLFNDAIAKVFAKCSWALRVVEDESFHHCIEVCRALPAVKLPSRKELAKLQVQLAERTTQAIISKAADSELPSSLALDGWNNCRQSKVTNVLLISNNQPKF
jgi:hypothetical protein